MDYYIIGAYWESIEIHIPRDLDFRTLGQVVE